jgi:hypothetical protein
MAYHRAVTASTTRLVTRAAASTPAAAKKTPPADHTKGTVDHCDHQLSSGAHESTARQSRDRFGGFDSQDFGARGVPARSGNEATKALENS